MKTTFKRTNRRGTTRPASRGIRAIVPRLGHNPVLSRAAMLPQPALPARELKPAEPASSDLPHGDVLQLYLREIGQVKLLTPAEEIALAKRIRRGDKRAREQMIKANLRLVVKIAHDYEGMGLPLLDLINEGNIGLMKGVERFDPRKGAKLSTYASWWIKQSIKRALANQGKTIRLPVHVVDKVAHIRRAEVKLRGVFDRDPTDEELAHELDLDPRRIRQYRQASKAPVSLDAPIGDDASERVAEIVADPNAAAPFDRLVQETDTQLVREVLGTLDQRENKILAMRFGLKDGTQRTLEEVGAHLGVTRERIRQIQEQALKKLRAKMEERDRPTAEENAALAVAV
ncbi:MAG TPA: sigma-70 family RNA polymerase sigma factor [Verrucomicrobiae bacterium]|nr:sigma-70 family RNA polymerase sigma factor [Verrucomicrobiae bacterium]